MVKAEPDRDYYADLDLPPSATANEIKKQFKKLALQYHPDRNPLGDTTAKFQAIQSANEILTDPQQRAKYDAQRIRSGLLHTYTDAPPPPPRRPGWSNFPAPPPPPPTSAKKSAFSPPPSASGPQKYARFSTPDPPSWRTRTTDDVKSKTNDFKAWEHMRHGQGPVPRGRKETKYSSFQSERDRQDYTGQNVNNNTPKKTTHRRTEWENLPDAGMPNMQRSNSVRMPPKASTYAPSTPGAGNDESQARSAYFKISQDRPASSRAQTNMPPPPSRAPTAKKPDPLQAFKSSNGANDPPIGSHRPQTQYPTVRGEKTNLSPSPGIHRSSTTAAPLDNNRRGFRDKDSLRANGHHVRSASASSPFRFARTAGMASVSTTSSESSSEEEEAAQKQEAADLSKSAFNRPKQQPKPRRPHVGAGAPQRSFFNPYEAKDEPMVSDAAYSGPRRHSGIELPTHKRADDPPEGFMEHRKKHEAAHPHHQGFSGPSGSEPPHFMQRHKSFDEQYRRSVQDEHYVRPSTANKETTPMYDLGFRWGSGDLPKPFDAVPPLRSHSTENIDMKFSPSVNPPKFGEGSGFSSFSRSGDTSDDPIEIHPSEGSPNRANSQVSESSPVRTPSGPPPKGPACFFPNDWHQRAWAGTFQADPGKSQSRTSSQRRTGTPRASSSNNVKQNGSQKAAGLQSSVNDAGDEPPSYSAATGEYLSSSRVSSDGSAMDIDPVLTPPSANDNHQQGTVDEVSPTRPNEHTKLSDQVPAPPPRVAVPVQTEADSLSLGVGDFKHVKPFGPDGDGLETIDDLSQTLPFESRASFARPSTEKNSQGLKMPKPPKAPSPPKLLNPTTWQSYVTEMVSYMSSWSRFSNTMLSHFQSRQEAQKQMNSSWMSVQGDSDYNAYMKSLTEDEKVRKWWEVACDNHKNCINTLGRVRVAMKEEMARAKNFPYPN